MVANVQECAGLGGINSNLFLTKNLMQIKPVIERLFFVVALICSVVTMVFVFLAATEFGQVFQSFGNELPFATHLFLKFYFVALLLPLFVVATWHYCPVQKYRSLAALFVGFACSFATVIFLVWVLYLPIFSLAQ